MRKYDGYALITGGNGGFGLEYAKQLAAAGYDLVLVARNEIKLESAKKLLSKEFGVDVVTIAQDLSKLDSTDNIMGVLSKKKIHVGLLVNNAGFSAMRTFHEISYEMTMDMIKVMCLSVTELTHRLIPAMLEKGSGGIIIMSSVTNFIPGPQNAVYFACKSFEYQLARSLHADYAGTGIDVLGVCPGFTETELFSRGIIERPLTKFHDPVFIVKAALEALGEKVMVLFPNSLADRIGFFLAGILPYKLMEKISITMVQRLWEGK